MERSVTKPKLPPSDDVDDRQEVQRIFANLCASLPELEKLLRDCQGHWGYEDGVYRFYQHSFKVYSLQTNRRIAEFKFMRWRGGSESIRQNSLFKDFYQLAESRTRKSRFLYLLELERPLKFLRGQRALTSVMSRNTPLLRDFRRRYGTRFQVVRDYYGYRRDRVQLVDLTSIVPEFKASMDELSETRLEG